VCLLAAALTAGALAWTERGSVDRWWYLGYVRAWSEGTFSSSEPFLASGHVHPRFAFSSWLAGLAVWANLARVDPVWLYERAAPLMLIPTAFAAQLRFGRALFLSERVALFAALCAGLLWAGGGPVAVLSRAPEDKVLASVLITPVLWSAVVPALEDIGRRNVWLAAAAAFALCTVHPIAFVVAGGAAAAFAAWTAWRKPAARMRAAALVAVLAAASLYPLASGALARSEYMDQGVAELAADHPVARVHRARERLISAPGLGYIVDPRLLTHPVAIIGLFALVLLPMRPPRERRFLAAATVLPLAIAFTPPLAEIAGQAILPWMVHRLLWTLPLAALAAVAADEAVHRLGGRSALVVLALVVASIPAAARAMSRRESAERTAVAVPPDARLHAALAAVRALPSDAIVAAAPELSERLPALTGRRVLAMSDRATVAFSGAREAGEARLRARAALFGGLWKPAPDVPSPTHVLYAPASAASGYCREKLFENEAFVLCSFAPSPPPPGIRMAEAPETVDGPQRTAVAGALGKDAPSLSATCNDVRSDAGDRLVWTRPGPWSAAFTSASCELRATDGARVSAHSLVLVPLLGRAVEELTIQATGLRNGAQWWRVRTRLRAHDRETLRFALPQSAVNAVRIEIIPSFLPFLKLATFDVTFDDDTRRGP
jgi:hypothetical protein